MSLTCYKLLSILVYIFSSSNTRMLNIACWMPWMMDGSHMLNGSHFDSIRFIWMIKIHMLKWYAQLIQCCNVIVIYPLEVFVVMLEC